MFVLLLRGAQDGEGAEGGAANVGILFKQQGAQHWQVGWVADFSEEPCARGPIAGMGMVEQQQHAREEAVGIDQIETVHRVGHGAMKRVGESASEDSLDVRFAQMPERFDGVGANAGIGIRKKALEQRQVSHATAHSESGLGANAGFLVRERGSQGSVKAGDGRDGDQDFETTLHNIDVDSGIQKLLREEAEHFDFVSAAFLGALLRDAERVFPRQATGIANIFNAECHTY